METYRIVIADDDMETIELLKMTLQMDNYEVIATFDGKAALKKVQEEKPDIVLLDYDMPGMNGHEVCKSLKSSNATRYIPVIILSGTRTKVYDKINGLEAGADDYMVKPFDPNELRARILRSIQKTNEIISLNPLTKLPGSTRIEEEITSRLNNKAKFAVGYVDLDHFKAYNDAYGYKKGDDVIHLLHEVIFEATNLCGTPDDFIGHIGGDDFIIVSLLEKIDEVCGYITKNFDQRIPAYYTKEDRERGHIVTADRRGNQRSFPITTVSIGVSTNEKREIIHYGEIIDILIEMKKYAKSLEQKEGSTFVRDKRSSRTKVF
jgi:diguanylate cyclase (GGDEF)-like protein